MSTWKEALREGAVSGSIASVLSAACLAWEGRRSSTPAAPMNAVSHWIFGDRALREDATDATHTLTGYLIHHAAAVFWGTLHARFWGAKPEHKKPLPALAGAAAAAGIACFTDFQLTPSASRPASSTAWPSLHWPTSTSASRWAWPSARC
jgi:hypothetical protein